MIASVRGAGLFIGIEIVEDGRPSAQATARIVNGLRERHVLISASGPHANVLKIRPPLIFSQANADTFLEAFHSVLTETH